jgi:hypothetical protein
MADTTRPLAPTAPGSASTASSAGAMARAMATPVFPLRLAGGFQPRCELRPDEVAAFDARGYHIHEPLFSPTEVAAIRGACEAVAHHRYATGTPPDCRMWEPGMPRTAVCKIDNAWKSDPLIQAAVTSPRLGRVAAQLIGADGMRLFHDQYLRKPADGGGIVTWHQDYMFWHMIDRCRTVTCWIALADVAPDAGPMLFLEGSHRLGLIGEKPTEWTGDALPPTPIAGHREVPVVVRAGQVTFHHGLMVHASACNTGSADRFSLVSHAMADDCEYRAGYPHMCEEFMKRYPEHPGVGERFGGPQFPLMWTGR